MRIYYFIKALLSGHIQSVAKAKEMGLKPYQNIYGDGINERSGARSEWVDEFGNIYLCDELWDKEAFRVNCVAEFLTKKPNEK